MRIGKARRAIGKMQRCTAYHHQRVDALAVFFLASLFDASREIDFGTDNERKVPLTVVHEHYLTGMQPDPDATGQQSV